MVYDYTIHFTNGSLADKMGCCMFFRRSFKGFSLLTALLRNLDIARVPSDCLTQLLKVHSINMRKTATKVCKIRSLCQVETVLKDLSAEEVKGLEELLKNMESKKKKATRTKMKTWTNKTWTLVYSLTYMLRDNFWQSTYIHVHTKEVPHDEQDPVMIAAEQMLTREMNEDEAA